MTVTRKKNRPVKSPETTDQDSKIGHWDRIGWGFSYQISDIRGDIGDTCALRVFISDIIYNEILITKS